MRNRHAGSARLHPLLERREHSRVEAASRALVGKGGVGEAIAQHDLAARQCRLDHLRDVVAAGREHQQRFGQRVHRLFEHQGAQRLGQRRAAGFARAHHGAALRLEAGFQRVEVARLARAVDAFQRQKQTAIADRTHWVALGWELLLPPPRW
ncbi:hypothetical protein D9M68_837070 [compost metagenome]